MRKFLIVAVFALALLGMLAPPVFAQAPTPKVTITGLFDQITSAGANIYDGSNFARTSDKEWYARTRFRPDFEFAVGRTKAVLGLEIDLGYGQGGASDGGFPGNVTGALPGKAGNIAGLDINTDVAGLIEVKWIYTEFDLTGKDSLLPFIPVQTVARAGGQPFASLANYKIAYANGDFAGVSMRTTFAPNLMTNLAYVMVEDAGGTLNRGAAVSPQPTGALTRTTRGDDFAIIFSPEITPMKGLDIKPLYSYFHGEGLTSGSARRNVTNRFSGTGGLGTTNGATTWGGGSPAGDVAQQENRHTIGFDGRWRSGPFGLDPTVYYQWGTRDNQCVCPNNGAGFTQKRVETHMNSWLVDVQGSFQAGPFLLEVRANYSTGNNARDNLARSIHYYEPLDLDTSYYAGWASILALGIDYYNGGNQANANMATNVGYDRYGRAQFGVRGTYNVTPALAFYAVVSPTWTAKKVDTDWSGTRTVLTDRSFVEGDSSYIGTEGDIGMTWRFAPNVAFDLSGAYLWAGDALKVTEILNGVATKRDQHDGWTVASRIRLSF